MTSGIPVGLRQITCLNGRSKGHDYRLELPQENPTNGGGQKGDNGRSIVFRVSSTRLNLPDLS